MAQRPRTRTRTRKPARGFSDMNPSTDREKKPDEIVDMLKLGPDYKPVRMIGGVVPYAKHWIEIKNREGGTVNIPKTPLNFNSETDTFDSTIENPYDDIPNTVKTSKHYYVNVIAREEQENEPKRQPPHTQREKKTGLKEKDSKSWTPVRVLRVPTTVAKELQNLAKANVRKLKSGPKSFDLTHEKFGRDILILYDEAAAGSAKYSVSLGERSPLTEEEKEYLVWDLDNLMEPEDLETAKKEADALAGKISDEEMTDGEDEDDEDVDALLKAGYEEDEKPRRRKPATKRKAASKASRTNKATRKKSTARRRKRTREE